MRDGKKELAECLKYKFGKGCGAGIEVASASGEKLTVLYNLTPGAMGQRNAWLTATATATAL